MVYFSENCWKFSKILKKKHKKMGIDFGSIFSILKGYARKKKKVLYELLKIDGKNRKYLFLSFIL